MSQINRIYILHAFDHYLNTTENWMYRIIKNFSKNDLIITSKFFLDNEFRSQQFTYIDMPLHKITSQSDSFVYKLLNKIIGGVILLGYPLYLLYHARKFQISLLHSHYGPTGWRYQWLASILQIPHVVSFYGFDYEKLPADKPIWNKRYNSLFNSANAFICEGKFGAEILKSKGCPQEKIHVVHLGLELNNIPIFQRKKNIGELHLLQIATLTYKKGHKYTLEAFAKAAKTCPNMTLTIVGSDQRGIKKDLIQFVNNNRLKDKVFFLDAIDFTKLYEFMRNFQVFIHPSCHTVEHDCEGGAPVVLLDAQATGMPVISTIHCDIPEEVITGKTGILVPERESEKIADAIRFFYKMDDAEYQNFSEQSIEYVRNEFNVKKTVQTLEKIYSDLISNHDKCRQ